MLSHSIFSLCTSSSSYPSRQKYTNPRTPANMSHSTQSVRPADCYCARLADHFPVSELTSLPQIITHSHPSHGRDDSIYAGQPNNSTAAAWTHLLSRTSSPSLRKLSLAISHKPAIAFYFNISTSELLRAGFDSSSAVRVKGGGYLASLGVYHQLHCLVRSLILLLLFSTCPADKSYRTNSATSSTSTHHPLLPQTYKPTSVLHPSPSPLLRPPNK